MLSANRCFECDPCCPDSTDRTQIRAAVVMVFLRDAAGMRSGRRAVMCSRSRRRALCRLARGRPAEAVRPVGANYREKSQAATAAGGSSGVRTWLRRPGYADQVALRVGEVPDHQARRRPLGAHHALAAQPFGPLQGGLDIGHAACGCRPSQ